MKPPGPPKFLARNSYRRRRVMNAARVLPVVASVLFFIPVLWKPSETPEPDTARGAIYVFCTWFGLIVAALFLSRVLERADRKLREGAPDTDEGPR